MTILFGAMFIFCALATTDKIIKNRNNMINFFTALLLGFIMIY